MKEKPKTFTDGYIVGWQSVRGRGQVPGIPAYALPAGKTEYDHGFDRGEADAEDALRTPNPNEARSN